MKIIGGFLVICLIALWATPSRADLDHVCLNQCVTTGNSATACIAQCTYGPPPQAIAPIVPISPAALTAPVAPSHRVLDTPLPVGNEIVLEHKAMPPQPSKDYACLAQCLHGGQIYHLCEERCTKLPCATGSSACSDLTGSVNGVKVSGTH